MEFENSEQFTRQEARNLAWLALAGIAEAIKSTDEPNRSLKAQARALHSKVRLLDGAVCPSFDAKEIQTLLKLITMGKAVNMQHISGPKALIGKNEEIDALEQKLTELIFL